MDEEKDMTGETSPKTAASPAGATEELLAMDEGGEKSGPATAVDLPEDLPAAYQKVVADKLDLYDRLLRKQAELDNFRKRVAREKEDFFQHANTDLIRSLLPVLDGFERALRHQDPKAND